MLFAKNGFYSLFIFIFILFLFFLNVFNIHRIYVLRRLKLNVLFVFKLFLSFLFFNIVQTTCNQVAFISWNISVSSLRFIPCFFLFHWHGLWRNRLRYNLLNFLFVLLFRFIFCNILHNFHFSIEFFSLFYLKNLLAFN